MIKKLSKNVLIKFAASLHLTVICLAVLAVLTFWGTLYQVEQGLYLARTRFFASWFLLIGGFIPFPGTKLVILVLSVNLIASFFIKIKFTWKKSGILLVHAGLALLFLAAGFTHYFAEESYLSLVEGDKANYSSSYRNWEIALFKNKKAQSAFTNCGSVDFENVVVGKRLEFGEYYPKILVARVYKNAKAVQAKEDHYERVRRLSSIDSLIKMKPDKDPSKNTPALICAVENLAPSTSRLILHGIKKNTASFVYNRDIYTLMLQPEKNPLPLSIKLIDFQKVNYTGTKMAREYKSRIYAKGEDIDREVIISMNRPFRYKSFTFFQSSFSQKGKRESSTFAVVKNPARNLPYIASFLIMAGFVLHFLSRLVAGINAFNSRKK